MLGFHCPFFCLLSLFLIFQQLVDLDFVHVLHVLQVQAQLLSLLCLLPVHLQDCVVSLLQLLVCTGK